MSLALTKSVANLRRDVAGVQLQSSPVVERRGEAGFPFGERWPFGLGLVGASVIIYPGPVRHGVRSPIWIGQTNKTFTGDGYWYLPLEYTLGSVVLPAATAIEPVSDGDTFRTWLYKIRVVSGFAYFNMKGRGGDLVEFPEIWA